MRLDIRYRMMFSYDTPVWESQKEIRVRPRDDNRQHVISYRLTTAPVARALAFVDYWGTTVAHVGVREPHLGFEIVAEAAVETSSLAPFAGDAPMSALSEPEFALGHVEYLAPSAHTRWSRDIAATAADAVVGAHSVHERIDAVVDAAHDILDYESGSTEIGVGLDELVMGGKGVCQDYAHLTISLLRSLGIPARYVSGYLFAADETSLGDDTDDVVRVQTHAWVEAAVPGCGWYASDPTNRQPVTERHVVIGHGRDYDDVAPVRGVFTGSATPTVDAEVVIARMGPAVSSVIADAPRRLTDDQLILRRRQSQQQQ